MRLSPTPTGHDRLPGDLGAAVAAVLRAADRLAREEGGGRGHSTRLVNVACPPPPPPSLPSLVTTAFRRYFSILIELSAAQ